MESWCIFVLEPVSLSIVCLFVSQKKKKKKKQWMEKTKQNNKYDTFTFIWCHLIIKIFSPLYQTHDKQEYLISSSSSFFFFFSYILHTSNFHPRKHDVIYTTLTNYIFLSFQLNTWQTRIPFLFLFLFFILPVFTVPPTTFYLAPFSEKCLKGEGIEEFHFNISILSS